MPAQVRHVKSADIQNHRMAARRNQCDMGIINARASASIPEQSIKFASITLMDQIVNAHTPEILGVSPGEDFGRPGCKGNCAGGIKLDEQIRTAKCQRDKAIPFGPQVFGTLTVV